jgi:hypothetical protein
MARISDGSDPDELERSIKKMKLINPI